jgi:1-deoxy-D-xylulose-5-phosphate reductoisomerase
MKKKIAILGSTGSIGKTLINILKKDKKNFEIILLTSNVNINELIKQTIFFDVKNLIITNHEKFLIAKKLLKNKKINIYNNFNSINTIFKKRRTDYTMSAVSSFHGLEPTLMMIKYSKKIAIANKESIICGWPLIKKGLKKYKSEFIPIDSEHFSILSLINKSKSDDIEKVFITASGGPFINYASNKFNSITVKEALKHPNWSMGKKISIDSATMMNKVFEIIEAKKIFNLDYKKLEMLVHTQSYIHAIVKFTNGITKMLIHDTNMTIPIFNSLYQKLNKKIKSQKLDLSILNNLNLKEINNTKFPVIKIIKNLPKKDSLFETVIVSANDTLVNLFLNKKIKFTDISKILMKIINMREFTKFKTITPKNVDEIIKLTNYVSLKITTMSI